jgi:hypothetical protein
MTKKEIEQRLKELNKMPFTDEVIKEITYWEMQLERIIDNN